MDGTEDPAADFCRMARGRQRPRDGDWRAGYVLLQLGEADRPGEADRRVEGVRLEYDLERAMAAIRESDLPDDFAEYLCTGGQPS